MLKSNCHTCVIVNIYVNLLSSWHTRVATNATWVPEQLNLSEELMGNHHSPHQLTIQDYLLADVAIRIQLSPTNYQKAVERYEAINSYLDRPESLLHDRIEIYYPQGSMAIGSTIASNLTTDHFDLDTIAQLQISPHANPAVVLDLLFNALNGSPGSRYYGKVTRNSRCVTVEYEDGMRIDVTPMVRRITTPERESVLFHHRRETPGDPGYHKVANPFGFAVWFNGRTPPEAMFAEQYTALVKSHMALAEAEQEPIPDQENLHKKSMALIALQLTKRYRNVRFDRRQVRRPPSVLLAKWVADVAGGGRMRLIDELLHQVRRMRQILGDYVATGRLAHEVNPVCAEDVLTDRWPAKQADQVLFVEDLDHLIAQLERLHAGCPITEMREILSDLFGERPSSDAVKAFGDKYGNHVQRGGLYVPGSQVTAGSAALVGLTAGASAHARSTPSHTFFGGATDA